MLEAVGTNLLDNPAMAGIVINSRDITARKQAEDALQQERNFVSTILNTVGALVVVLDQQGGIVRFNRTCEQITGYSFAEVKGKPFWDLLLTPEERDPVRADFEKLRAGKFPAEYEHHWVAKDGTRRLIAWANTVLLDEAEAVTHIISTGIDITARKHAEVLLKEEGEVTAALARVGQEMISSLDTPVILERLCRLTAEVLDCDYSHTTLWQPTEDAYVVVAGYGETSEQAEARRAFKMPRTMLARLLARLEKEEVIEFEVETSRDSLTKSLLRKLHLTTTLWVPLWKGTEIIGMQSASHRGAKRFGRRHKRLARGISQIASLALGNARLFEELERANRLKEDFVSSMSHELRTPLNIIMGYNELLREGTFGALTAEQIHALLRIDKSATELLDVINATLDFSRLQGQRPPVTLKEVRVADLLAELEADTHHLNRQSSIRLEWQPPLTLPSLYTDSVKLKMVLKNLITNALKFTEEGVITVAALPQGAGIEFRVSDTGIGIAPEALPIIFEPFRQLNSSLTRRHGGVGLGLYIVRQLLNLLGGTVSVESTLGKGSTFRVWVPSHARQ
jgi:PAS domain S-box-containing protein